MQEHTAQTLINVLSSGDEVTTVDGFLNLLDLLKKETNTLVEDKEILLIKLLEAERKLELAAKTEETSGHLINHFDVVYWHQRTTDLLKENDRLQNKLVAAKKKATGCCC